MMSAKPPSESSLPPLPPGNTEAGSAENNDTTAPRTIAQRVGLARAEAQSYYERGLRAFAMHSYEDALADLDAAIERAPGYTELYCARGVIAMEAGKLPGAKEDFEYALSQSKRQWLALYGLGSLAAGRNAWKEAVGFFTQAQAIAPGRPEVWYYRAVALYNLGETDKAAADMKTALRWLIPGDRRRPEAQKWLKFLDPNAEIETPAEKAAAKTAKESKSGKEGKNEKSKEPKAQVSERHGKTKQIEAGRGEKTAKTHGAKEE
jgi:tetratricopeptide (TPR) repeat protein